MYCPNSELLPYLQLINTVSDELQELLPRHSQIAVQSISVQPVNIMQFSLQVMESYPELNQQAKEHVEDYLVEKMISRAELYTDPWISKTGKNGKEGYLLSLAGDRNQYFVACQRPAVALALLACIRATDTPRKLGLHGLFKLGITNIDGFDCFVEASVSDLVDKVTKAIDTVRMVELKSLKWLDYVSCSNTN